ncbi:MAG: YchJ family protein [Zoogloea sp.]|nr:YchJ family protein [Zoogloea sp.]
MAKSIPAQSCPCDSGKPYAACCGRFHAGEPAPTPGALMRSRYAAFVLKRGDYLNVTWHPDTRPASLSLDETPAPKWLGLKVMAESSDGDAGVVEFIARYKVGGRAMKLHETSRFVRLDGRWVYVDGDIRD